MTAGIVFPYLYMAPIQGVTNHFYRDVYSKYFSGYDAVVTPFVASSQGSQVKRARLKDILPECNNFAGKIIPQILSKDADDFMVLAKAMFDLGYDTVNWNLGCPLPKVRNKDRGSGLMAYPDKIVSILEQVMPNIPNKLSLKVRLGRENSEDILRLLPRLNVFPLEEIIIHPRTGKQMYKGVADVDAFAVCLPLTKHTVVYNGDINSIETFKKLNSRFPKIKRWMIGRGGIADPFLPEAIKGISSATKEERAKKFMAFHNALLAVYQENYSGSAHVLDKMKELWFYWSKNIEKGNVLYQKICRAKTVEKYFSEIGLWFNLMS
ncbi:MAG: tRNA-dihydrouridine synthase family protein [Candidatus Omnitrophica bacterium]|nr:tRNA-dihydrouridine synthase family protein [Candidatus Omnitrophota bacterium]